MAYDTEITPKSHPKLAALRKKLKSLGYLEAALTVKVPESQAHDALKLWQALPFTTKGPHLWPKRGGSCTN